MSPLAEKIYKQALELQPQELAELVTQLTQVAVPHKPIVIPKPDDSEWTDEELAQALQHKLRSTKSIIDDGLFGSIPDFTDGKDTVEWIMEQKQKRMEKYQW